MVAANGPVSYYIGTAAARAAAVTELVCVILRDGGFYRMAGGHEGSVNIIVQFRSADSRMKVEDILFRHGIV